MLRQRTRVLVTTACSACSETARTEINAPGKRNLDSYRLVQLVCCVKAMVEVMQNTHPCPMEVGIKKKT